MSEYISKLTQIPEEELQPAAPLKQSNIHEIPLYVVTFEKPQDEPLSVDPLIITLPDSHLMTGRRVASVPIWDTAIQAAAQHQIISVAHQRLELPYDATRRYDQGYSVRRDSHTPLPDIADFTRTPYDANHGLPLEIHTHSGLVRRLEHLPGREREVAYLRKFGELALGQQA